LATSGNIEPVEIAAIVMAMKSLFLLIILFVIAIVLRIDFFFTVFYLFALIYALSHVWMQITARRMSVRRRFADHAFCGDQVEVDLRVHNGSWLPLPWLEVHETLPIQLATPPFYRQVFSLKARGDRRLGYVLHCHQRGYYAIGPLTVRTGDLLGIVRPRAERAEAEHLIVYPKVVPLEQLGLPTRSPLVALPAHSPLFEDPARVMGVRDYQRGDSPRRIHWTATAKFSGQSRPRLMVKQYEPAIARETLICLSLAQADYGHRQRYTATELAIVVAASLANHIVVQEGLPVGLVTEARDPLAETLERSAVSTGMNSAEPASTVKRAGRTLADRNSAIVHFTLPPRSGRGHLMSVLEVLARVQVPMQTDTPAGSSISASTTPFVELLRQAGTSLSWGATLCIITGRESPELFDAILSLRRAGFAVTLILVQPALTPRRSTQRPDYGSRLRRSDSRAEPQSARSLRSKPQVRAVDEPSDQASGQGLSQVGSEEFRLRAERLSVPVHTVWQESDLARAVDWGTR
jgi:uncharacterized protein (DUF58 family)